jgi:hypothetical protein
MSLISTAGPRLVIKMSRKASKMRASSDLLMTILNRRLLNRFKPIATKELSWFKGLWSKFINAEKIK